MDYMTDNERVLTEEIKTLHERLAESERCKVELENAKDERMRYQSGIEKLDAWIRALIRVGGDYQRFQTLVCQGIQDLVNADLTMLPLINEGKQTFTYRAAAGVKAPMVEKQTMPLEGGGLCGWVAAHGEALCVQDLFQDPRIIPDLARALDVTTGLLVPLRTKEGVIGGLSAFRKGKSFDQIDEQILTLFSQRVTTALDNMNLLRTLENRVAERTTALTEANTKLQQEIAERMRTQDKLQLYATELKQSNEDVLSFAYIVSHDLRAPLVSIKGFVGELQYALKEIESDFTQCLPHLEEKARARLSAIIQKDVPVSMNFISSSVTRMDGLINNILKLSRAGHRELKPELIDMKTLTDSILSSLAHQIERSKTSVIVEGLPVITADKIAMEQIMGNLLDNALKYLEQGRDGKITITAEQGAQETTFHVRDNGRGVAGDDLNKIFEIFRRAGKQDVAGEGMGLAYVKALVKRHDGRIWCESEPGAGTTFSFTIPNVMCYDLEAIPEGGIKIHE